MIQMVSRSCVYIYILFSGRRTELDYILFSSFRSVLPQFLRFVQKYQFTNAQTRIYLSSSVIFYLLVFSHIIIYSIVTKVHIWD